MGCEMLKTYIGVPKRVSIVVVFIIFLLLSPRPVIGTDVTRGIASQYAPGVMDGVLRNRVRWGQIEGIITPNAESIPEMLDGVVSNQFVNVPEVTVRPGVAIFGQYDGFVARPWAHEIGSTIWLRHSGGDWEKFLVADCGGIADGGQAWMLRNNVLVEIDWETAVRWDVQGRAAEIEMSMVEPRNDVEE